MNPSWLCTTCGLAPAASFCCCNRSETFLCQDCLPSHFSKTPNIIHHNIPLQAYGNHRSPNYYEQLEHRMETIDRNKAELMSNLERIDLCICDVAERINQAIADIWEHGLQITADLQREKDRVKKDIDKSVEEVERTVYENVPQLCEKYSELLRFSDSQTSFNIFEYRPQSIPNMSSGLPFDYDFIEIPQGNPGFVLPQIYGNTLKQYELLTKTTTISTLSVTFTDWTVFCLLNSDTVLCVGGNPANRKVYRLTLSTNTISKENQLITPRGAPGMIKVGRFVYLFGGHDGADFSTSSEKLSISERSWSRMTDMAYARSGFTPNLYGNQVFLVDFAKPHRVIETFCVETEQYRTLNVALLQTFQSVSSVSFIAGGELVIITMASEMGKLDLKTESELKQIPLKLTNRYSGYSNCPPMRIGKRVFWVRWKDAALISFDLDTNRVME